jgi:hypothetical protein
MRDGSPESSDSDKSGTEASESSPRREDISAVNMQGCGKVGKPGFPARPRVPPLPDPHFGESLVQSSCFDHPA